MKKIGIWFDFYKTSSIEREGISRFTYYLVDNLLTHHNCSIEIWFFPANRKIIEGFFSPLSIKHQNRIEFRTVKFKSHFKALLYSLSNLAKLLFTSQVIEWKVPYGLYLSYVSESSNLMVRLCDEKLLKYSIGLLSRVFCSISYFIKNTCRIKPSIFVDDLALEANRISEASIFLIPVMGHKLSLGLKKKQLLVLHDLASMEFEDLFAKEGYIIKEINFNIKNYIDLLIKQNSIFVTHSSHVKENQIIKNFPTISNVNSFYMPILHPSIPASKLLSEKELNEKFRIDSTYIFYPTQIRPYKNLSVLFKALQKILLNNNNIKLVLTNSNALLKQDNLFIKKNKIESNIVFTGSVNDQDLYSLYKHAGITVIPSLFEGNFPLQAMESLYMNTPVLLAKIPITMERLNYHKCSFSDYLFDPFNVEELSDKILQILENKERSMSAQLELRSKLLEVSWKDLSENYFNLIDKY